MTYRTSPSPRLWRRYATPAAGTAVLLAVVALAAGAPLLAHNPPDRTMGSPVMPPAPGLLLGTNVLGQDLYSHLLHGARTSLLVGFLVAASSTLLAAAVGAASAVAPRGREVVLAVVDLFLAIPGVPLVVLLVVFLGPGIWSVAAALLVISWAAYARVVRAQVLSAAAKEYVAAARALGASEARVLRTAILPEIVPILFTKFLLTLRWAIMMEAGLGLLGLADPGRVSWGLTLHQAFGYPLLFLTDAWLWWAAPLALAIVLTTLGLMAVGRDIDIWLNPAAADGTGWRPQAAAVRVGRSSIPNPLMNGYSAGPDRM